MFANRKHTLQVVFGAGLLALFIAILMYMMPAPKPPLMKLTEEQKDQILSSPQTISSSQPFSSGNKLKEPAMFLAKEVQNQPKLPDEEVKQKNQQTGQTLLTGIPGKQKDSNAGSSSSGSGTGIRSGKTVANSGQQKAIDRLLAILGKDSDIEMDSVHRTLRFLEGNLDRLVDKNQQYLDAKTQRDFAGMTLILADILKEVMNIHDPKTEFAVASAQTDEIGMTHVKLQQQYNGVPVFGAQMGVHYSKEDKPVRMEGIYAPTPVLLDNITPKITANDAVSFARKSVGMTGEGMISPKAKSMIYWDSNHAAELTYLVDVTPSLRESWRLFISAIDGHVVHKLDNIIPAAAKGQAKDVWGTARDINCWQEGTSYYAVDTSKPMFDAQKTPVIDPQKSKGTISVLDLRNGEFAEQFTTYYVTTKNVNQWDPAAVSLITSYGIIYDYYSKTFKRNSIDANGMNMIGIVHAMFKEGSSLSNDNAFWTDAFQLMVFGDGSQAFKNLPGAIDVAAHETTHGVVSHTAALIYENQSGALNEHIADFFGAMVDRSNWTIGDNIVNQSGMVALRDMSNPHNPKVLSQLPMNMNEYKNLPIDQDNGGVHINCGIPSYMSYLMCDGPGGLGKDKGEQIIFRALTNYLTQRSDFADYRKAVSSAAQDLYGNTAVQVVQNAFDQVGIVENSQTTPGDTPGQVVNGTDEVLFLYADAAAGKDSARNDYYYQLVLNNGAQLVLAASRYVVNTRPAVSGNGKYWLYVGIDNNVYWCDGKTEKQITTTGDVRSIAMSKDERYIAYTAISDKSKIFLIDFTLNKTGQADLVISREGVAERLTMADVLTFNFRGDTLVYDALSELVLPSGEKRPVWGIYQMRLADLVSNKIYSQSSGEQIGNPIFSNTSDHNFLADYYYEKDNTYYNAMLAFDTLAQKIGILLSPLMDFPQPTFRGDDKSLIFKGRDPQSGIYFMAGGNLSQDGMAMDINSLQYYLTNQAPYAYPMAFRVGAFQASKGELSTPASLDIGISNIGSEVKNSLTVQNIGNADVDILGITITGADADSFTQTGINQRILAGKSLVFDVILNPKKAGDISAVLEIQSTANTESVNKVQLIGKGTSLAATPTPTAPMSLSTFTPTPTAPMQLSTFTPAATAVSVNTMTPVPSVAATPSPAPTSSLITPTNTPLNLPTPTPGTSTGSLLNHLLTYEFDKATLDENGWAEILGGFDAAPAGSISVTNDMGSMIPSSKDGKGLLIKVQPKQVAFAYAKVPVKTGGKPVLIRLTVRASSPSATLALAALRGSFTSPALLDGSIGMNFPKTTKIMVEREYQLVMLYEPDQGEEITPVIQAAASGAIGTVNVYVDKMEILQFNPGAVNDFDSIPE